MAGDGRHVSCPSNEEATLVTQTTDLLASGFMFLEAPKWRDGKLYISDVFDHKVVSIASDGSREVVCQVPGRPAGQDFLPDGRHIVVSATDQSLYEVRDRQLRLYADLSGVAAGYLNDFAVDSAGRIYVGDFGYDFDNGEPEKPTRLHRVDPDGRVTAVADDVYFPNGSAVIHDGKTLVLAETWKGRIKAFDLASDGSLSNARIFAELESGQPDGLCADAEGGVWVGCYNTGDVMRILDGGRVTHKFNFPGSAISCTLGGDEGNILFMTVFLGPHDEITLERKSAVYSTKVDVPRIGS